MCQIDWARDNEKHEFLESKNRGAIYYVRFLRDPIPGPPSPQRPNSRTLGASVYFLGGGQFWDPNMSALNLSPGDKGPRYPSIWNLQPQNFKWRNDMEPQPNWFITQSCWLFFTGVIGADLHSSARSSAVISLISTSHCLPGDEVSVKNRSSGGVRRLGTSLLNIVLYSYQLSLDRKIKQLMHLYLIGYEPRLCKKLSL